MCHSKPFVLSLLSVSAWPYTQQDLEDVKHAGELEPRESITLNLDYKQMGGGGDNSWGARTHPEYLLPASAMRYRFRLRPYDASMGDMNEVARHSPPAE